MSQHKQRTPEKERLEFAIILLLILYFVASTLIMLIKFLLGVAAFVGLGIAIYRLYLYDKKTGNITAKMEEHFNLTSSGSQNLALSQKVDEPFEDGSFGGNLSPIDSSSQTFIGDIQKEPVIKKIIQEVVEELKDTHQNDITDAIAKYSDEIEIQKKKEALGNIYTGISEVGYNESDTFEIQQHHKNIKKQKDELDIRAMRQEVSEELFDQKQIILEHKYETKDEFINVRYEMTEGFNQIKENLLLLTQDFMTFKTYVSEKFSALEMSFLKEMHNLKEMLIRLDTEFKQETADMKLRFGSEILRIDKQQLTIVDKMRTYESQVKKFGIEVIKIKMDAEKFSMRGQEMLAKADIAQQQHKVQVQQLSENINVSLEKMALKEQGFANKVGTAKLRMDEISNQQYLALKDMAYERIGINSLRDDYQNRVTLEQEKFDRLNDQKRHLLQQIRTEQAHGRETAGLQHQLTMTKQNLNSSQNHLSLVTQELGQVRRLT